MISNNALSSLESDIGRGTSTLKFYCEIAFVLRFRTIPVETFTHVWSCLDQCSPVGLNSTRYSLCAHHIQSTVGNLSLGRTLAVSRKFIIYEFISTIIFRILTFSRLVSVRYDAVRSIIAARNFSHWWYIAIIKSEIIESRIELREHFKVGLQNYNRKPLEVFNEF